jgi:hypothetical protein
MRLEDVTEAANIGGMEQRIDRVRDEDESHPDPDDVDAAVRIMRWTVKPVFIHKASRRQFWPYVRVERRGIAFTIA